MRHIDQGTLDDCREALRHGRTMEQLAGMLRVDAGELSSLLTTPGAQPAKSRQPADDPGYLWHADALDAVL